MVNKIHPVYVSKKKIPAKRNHLARPYFAAHGLVARACAGRREREGGSVG